MDKCSICEAELSLWPRFCGLCGERIPTSVLFEEAMLLEECREQCGISKDLPVNIKCSDDQHYYLITNKILALRFCPFCGRALSELRKLLPKDFQQSIDDIESKQ